MYLSLEAAIGWQDWLGRPKKLSGGKSSRESSNKHSGDTCDALATGIVPHMVYLWMASGGYRPGQAEGRGLRGSSLQASHLTVLSWGHCVLGPSPLALAGDDPSLCLSLLWRILHTSVSLYPDCQDTEPCHFSRTCSGYLELFLCPVMASSGSLQEGMLSALQTTDIYILWLLCWEVEVLAHFEFGESSLPGSSVSLAGYEDSLRPTKNGTNPNMSPSTF